MDTSEPPIVFIPLQEKITRDEIIQNIKDNQGKVFFMLRHDWYGIDTCNLLDTVDDLVEDAYLLMGLKYTPMAVDGEDIIFIVEVSHTEEYILDGKDEDEEKDS